MKGQYTGPIVTLKVPLLLKGKSHNWWWGTFRHFHSGIGCQLVSEIGWVVSPSGKYQLQIFINAGLYLGVKS